MRFEDSVARPSLGPWLFALSRVSRGSPVLPAVFAPGAEVQLTSDAALAYRLAEGHGGWAAPMADCLGRSGTVVDVATRRGARVCVCIAGREAGLAQGHGVHSMPAIACSCVSSIRADVVVYDCVLSDVVVEGHESR